MSTEIKMIYAWMLVIPYEGRAIWESFRENCGYHIYHFINENGITLL